MRRKILIIAICASTLGMFSTGPLVYAGEDTIALKQQIDTLQKKIDELEKALQEKPEYSYGSSEQEWNPFWEMDRMQDKMNKMFRGRFGQGLGRNVFPGFGTSGFYDADIDIHETKGQYVVKMDLPGMDKANINIETQGDQLVISGERKSQTEENDQAQHYYRKERSFGYFSRSIPLPDDADKTGVNAEYKNGVLTVKIAKIETSEPKSPRKIIKIN